MVFHYTGVFTEILPSGDQAPSFISGITGQTTQYNRYSISENFGIFGAFLYPFAVTALFGVAATDLSNRSVTLALLCGPEGVTLEERMLLAPDTVSRVEILSDFLTRRLRTLEIAYDCGYYDQSHFIHEFKAFSGHHPSEYFGGRAEAAQWKA